MNVLSISIIIPCYNQSQYLTDCLQSVIAQTVTDWEAIVVDDASTDGEAIESIVSSFRDPRIKLIHHEQNRGLAAARNTGIRASDGEYVLPLDADDKLDPCYLEKTFVCLLSHPGYDCVFTNLRLFGVRDDVWRLEVLDVATLLERQWIPGAGALFRKQLWEKTGGYCEDKCLRAGNEDWDFWLSVAECSLRVAHVPEPLYHYRQHLCSKALSLRYSEHLTREYIYKRHKALFDRYRK